MGRGDDVGLTGECGFCCAFGLIEGDVVGPTLPCLTTVSNWALGPQDTVAATAGMGLLGGIFLGGIAGSGTTLDCVCVGGADLPGCADEPRWRFVIIVGAPIGVLDLLRAEADLPLGAWVLDPPPIGLATTAGVGGVALVLG